MKERPRCETGKIEYFQVFLLVLRIRADAYFSLPYYPHAIWVQDLWVAYYDT